MTCHRQGAIAKHESWNLLTDTQSSFANELTLQNIIKPIQSANSTIHFDSPTPRIVSIRIASCSSPTIHVDRDLPDILGLIVPSHPEQIFCYPVPPNSGDDWLRHFVILSQTNQSNKCTLFLFLGLDNGHHQPCFAYRVFEQAIIFLHDCIGPFQSISFVP